MTAVSSTDHGRGQHEDKLSGWGLGLCIVTLVTGVFLAALDLSIISTAIPRITTDFHSLEDVGWYGSAYFLTTSVFQPVWGKVFMHLSLKYGLIASLIVFLLGTLACAVANDSPSLIAGRAVSGFGAAGITTGVYTIISHLVDSESMPAFFGLVGLAFTVAGVVGPLVGGAFTSDRHLTWRWCFWINLPICGAVILVLLVFLKLPSTAKPKPIGLVGLIFNLDLPGTITILGSLLCYLFALELGGIRYPWSYSAVIGTLIGWILLALVSVGIEYAQGERAIVPRKFMKERGVLTCCAFIFCFECAVFHCIYFLPIQFQAIYGLSAARSGVLFLALLVPTSVFSILAGAALAKIGYYQPFLLTGAGIATIGSGLIYTLGIDLSLGKVIGYQILIGLGDGLVVQIPVTAVQAFASVEDIPFVTGTILFWQLCGGVVGIAAGQSIFSNRLLQTLPQNAPNVSPADVLRAGAYAVAQSVPAESLQGVRESYLISLRGGWAISIAFCGLAFALATLVPPISITGRVGAHKMSSIDTGTSQPDVSASGADEKNVALVRGGDE